MTDIKPAPYPADTSAKGWRFEIAMEKVRQSDTWSLTLLRGYEPKALLLWMWSVAWEQTPCGSFPNDETLIAARLELPPKVWAKHRDILMRNWWLASDGRLYHDTVTARVLSMLDKRANDAQRAAARRARKAESEASTAGVTDASRVTPPEPTREFDTKHQAPSTYTEPSGSVAAAKAPRGTRKCPAAFEPQDPQAWIDANAPGVDWQFETAKFRDHTFKTAISDWLGAWRNWMRRSLTDSRSRVLAMTYKERDAANAAARVHEMTGGLAAAKPPIPRHDALKEVFDDAHDTTRRLG